MSETPLLPNEKTGLLQSQPLTVPSSIWFRWFRALQETIYGPAGILAVQNVIKENFVFAAYGIETYSGTFPDLDATWQTMIFDAVPITPRGISYDLVANNFTIENAGVYSFNLNGGMAHKKDNVLEGTFIRAYNETEDAPGLAFRIGIPSQDSYVTITRPFLAELVAGDTYRLEIGGGDVITDIIFESLIAVIYNVGEWKGDLP